MLVVDVTGLLVVGFSDVDGAVVVVDAVEDATVVGTVTVVGFVVGAAVAGSVGGTLGTSVTVCPVALVLVGLAGIFVELLAVTWVVVLTVAGTTAAEFVEGTVAVTSFAE